MTGRLLRAAKSGHYHAPGKSGCQRSLGDTADEQCPSLESQPGGTMKSCYCKCTDLGLGRL